MSRLIVFSNAHMHSFTFNSPTFCSQRFESRKYGEWKPNYCLFLSLLIYLTQLNQLIITKWNKYPYWSMFSMSKCDNTCVHMSESSMFSSYNHYIPIKSNTRTKWLSEAVAIHVQYTQENESRWAKWKIAARKCAG